MAANDPAQVGRTLPAGEDLPALVVAPGYEQVRAVYTQGRTLEWRQPLALGDEPFGEISIGLSMVLIRNELIQSLRPAAIAVGLALVIAVSVAMLLAQVVLRPIHVITSGLTRLGRGELGKPLDLRDEEFRDLGDVFDQVSAQLQSAIGDGPKRAQLADLTRRVASLGRLTAGVAHEVKNPLNAMTIHLELLKQKLASPDPGAAGSACGGDRLGDPPPRRCGAGLPEVRQARGRDAGAGEDADAHRERPRGGRRPKPSAAA